jgi:rubrerythrin
LTHNAACDNQKDGNTRRLFEKLAAIEAKHQERIYREYARMTGREPDRGAFAKDAAASAVEGGLTTEEYLRRFRADLEIPGEVISLAMSIEAQALDLYQRAGDRADSADSREVLARIADEEREHLKQLGKLFETL